MKLEIVLVDFVSIVEVDGKVGKCEHSQIQVFLQQTFVSLCNIFNKILYNILPYVAADSLGTEQQVTIRVP